MLLDGWTAHNRFLRMLERMPALEQRHVDVREPGLVHIRLAPRRQNGLDIAHSNVRPYMLRDPITGAAVQFKAGQGFLDYPQTLPESVLPISTD